MIDEYIRKANAIKQCGFGMTSLHIADNLRKMPPADVAPVVHAYWEGEKTDCNIKCHRCGKAFRDYIITQDYVDLSEYPDYCPNCGAKMDAQRKE